MWPWGHQLTSVPGFCPQHHSRPHVETNITSVDLTSPEEPNFTRLSLHSKSLSVFQGLLLATLACPARSSAYQLHLSPSRNLILHPQSPDPQPVVTPSSTCGHLVLHLWSPHPPAAVTPSSTCGHPVLHLRSPRPPSAVTPSSTCGHPILHLQ